LKGMSIQGGGRKGTRSTVKPLPVFRDSLLVKDSLALGRVLSMGRAPTFRGSG
jgi:hypothetical protein